MRRYSFYPVVLLRSPAYAFSHEQFISLQQHLDSEYFRNALFIAAPQFYLALEKAEFEVAKLKPKAIRSLRNYLNRIYYRNTPFGMFSGFSAIRWQQEGETLKKVVLTKRQLHVLPELKEEILRSPEYERSDDLLLFSNPSIYRAGNDVRFLKSEYDYRNQKFDYHVSAMRSHKVIECILKRCSVPASLLSIKKAIREESELNEQQLLPLIQHLIKENLIICKTENNLLHAQEAHQSIFPESKLGEQDLKKEIQNVYANLQYKLQGGNVAQQQQSMIRDGLAALQVICDDIVPDGLRKFAAAFEKKFEGRAIPLMVALDPELGVGYRELEQTYQQSSLLEGIEIPKVTDPNKHIKWSRIHAVLLNKIQETFDLHKEGINLTREDLKLHVQTVQPLPSGLSVIFRPVNHKVFIESAGGASATSLFGRFSIFNEQLAETLRDIANNEVRHNPSVVFAEINCLQELHAGNVEHRLKVYPYEIPLMTYPASSADGIITLSDLWVNVDQGRIILWSERLQKEVIPRLSSAFNHSRSHMNVYRLLCDLQYQGLHTNFTLNLSHYFPNLNFYPRVTYQDAILSLACWELKLSDVTSIQEQDSTVAMARWRYYLENIGMPRYFSSYLGDQELIYDIESDEDLASAWRILQSRSMISFKEFPFAIDNNGVEDLEGRKYLAQYVTALLHQREVYFGDVSRHLVSSSLYDIPREANDWIYFKVYCHPGNAPVILKEMYLLVQHKLKAERLIDLFFYVIYLDPGYHLRIRFRCISYERRSSIITLLENALQPYREAGIVSGISIENYKRELERYGLNNIQLVEQIFDADTGWCMHFYTQQEDRESMEMDVIASVVVLMEAFSLTLEEKIMQSRQIYESLSKEFGGDRALTLSLNQKYRLYKTSWHEAFKCSKQDVQNNPDYVRLIKVIGALVNLVKSDDQNTIPLTTLCADVVHLHLNRLFPQQPREQEMVVYFLLWQYFKSLHYNNTGGV